MKTAAPKDSAESLIETIVDDVLKTAAMPFEDWLSQNRFPMIPMTIPADAGRAYNVTQAGVDAAHRLTAQTWNERSEFRQTIERSAFDRISFRAIGEALTSSPSHLPPDAQTRGQDPLPEGFFTAVVADYRKNLDRLAATILQTTDRHIPCNLFDTDQGVQPFAVGPVTFLPRADWIARYVKSTGARDHIRSVESGQLRYADLRDRALATGSDADLRTAWEVLSTLDGFEWVATVRIDGHELGRSHHKAVVVGGLAIDAIGLRFRVEDARRFTKAGRQHLFSEDRLATLPDGTFLTGWSTQRPGLGSAPGALAAEMAAAKPFLDAAGKLLEAYMRGRQTGRAPHLVERWANALYWVGEARREASDFMAVVDYGCAADGLSGAGGEAKAMTTFAEAALNPQAKPVPPGHLTIEDAVTKVYREGRNKIAHGETAGLFEDLSEIRSVGDSLLLALLDAVTVELAAIIDQRPEILAVPEEHAYRALLARLKARR